MLHGGKLQDSHQERERRFEHGGRLPEARRHCSSRMEQAPGVTARMRFELRAGDRESPSMNRFREVSIIFFTQIVAVSQVKTPLSSGQSCHRRLHLVLLYSSLRRRPCILYVPL